MNRSSAVTRAALALSMGLLAAGAASAQTMVNARVLSSTPVWEQVPVSDCRGAYPGAVRPSGPGTAVGAVVGGLIGSQLGRGSGHIAGAFWARWAARCWATRLRRRPATPAPAARAMKTA